jgi:spermidine synthase
LYQEYKLGQHSRYAPYVNYLFANSNSTIRLPSYWSEEGKTLIEYIIGPNVSPRDTTKITYKRICLNEEEAEDDDEEDEDDDDMDDEADTNAELQQLEVAFATITSRGWNEKLVPVFDMMNHKSGPDFNVDSTSVHDTSKDYISVFARRDIRRGEQLQMSYLENVDQYAKRFYFGLPHLLRDYGFVDQYPQRWKMASGVPAYINDHRGHPRELVFDVKQTVLEMGSNGDNSKHKVSYTVTWHIPRAPPTQDYVLNRLRQEFKRIHKLFRYVSAHNKNVPSDHEQAVIQEYYRSMYTALKEAIQSITGEVESDDFDEVHNHMACEDFEMIWIEDGDWNFVEETISHHQEVQIYHQPEQDDACLLLGNYLHACASNRPHYHEVFVHYPAYFLDKVKRVLFIGGGDSMVLHEVLKYKDLEKVVGLELDQQVVRTVFNRFGTQPHFDNDKVEWYFGDAAAALRALPREYYGTFDLVVVDILTRVAEVLKVTEEYSIMEAAMLLLQPNGIIIKNEDEGYKPGSSEKFTTHMVDLVYHDVPVYCLQTFVMGSNGIDFAKKQPIDHGVPMLYLKDTNDFRSQFDTWYTNSNGTSTAEIPKDGNEEDDEDNKGFNTESLSKTLGLTMVIEAEHLEVPLDSSSQIQDLIAKVLQDQAFSQTIVTPSVTQLESDEDEELEGGYSLSFLMKEGSVVARCFPLIKYCAFDVQLWSDLHKIDGMKSDLVNAVKSQKSSVYRIITSGLDNGTGSDKIGPPPKMPEEKSDNVHAAKEVEPSSAFVKMPNSTIEWRNATLHSYDNTDALQQWQSQAIVGVQSILQFKLGPSDIDTKKATQSLGKMLGGFFQVASGKGFVPSGVEVIAHEVEMSIDGAKSAIFMASWENGNMVALWDGTSQLDINLFSLTEEEPYAFAMVKLLIDKLKWNVVMAESFPRGVNRIMNFGYDYLLRERGELPFWA